MKAERRKRLYEALGLGTARRFASGVMTPARFRERFLAAKKRLSAGLERQNVLENAPFERVLEIWNVQPGREADFIRARRAELYCGIGLCAFAVLDGVRQAVCETPSFIAAAASACACLSVFCLGFVLMACALWRLSVLRKRRFVPFAKWLTRALTGGKA